MKTRRGSSLWPETDGFSSMIYRFEPGDIVIPVAVQQSHFLGVVKEVLPKINKIMVLWNGGCLKQHDPDEIMLEAHQNEIVRTRMASSRRSKGKSAEKIIAAKKDFDDLPDSEKSVAKKMAAKGYKYIAQIVTGEGKFGEPLYFKSADAVGPFLRSFPDYANAKTEWVVELPADIVKASENFEFAGSRRGSAVFPAKKSSEQTAAGRYEIIKVDWNDERSIRNAERKKAHLENQGYTLKQTKAGLTTSELVYVKTAAESQIPHGEQYVGNPETHGINEPRGGGFSIMQDLQKDLHREQKRESEAGPKTAVLKSRRATGEMSRFDLQPGGEYYAWAQALEGAAKEIQRRSRNLTRFREVLPFDVYRGPYAQMNNAKLWSMDDVYFFELFQGGSYGHRVGPANPETSVTGTTDEIADWLIKFHKRNASDYSSLRSRRAMYWGAPDRIYRLTKNEQENGKAVCPKCKKEMSREPFTKSEKLYTCQSCGFKVPTSKTTTTRVTIDVDKDTGEVDVDVTTAKGRRGSRSALAKEK